MQKIISLFARNYDGNRLVRNEIVSGAEWVIAGEGESTRKLDGTCCLIRDGKLFKRYDAKKGRTPPEGFEPTQEADPITGHWPGWLPVSDGPDDKWHRVGLANTLEVLGDAVLIDQTYELCGPHFNGNPEGESQDVLIRHGWGGGFSSACHNAPRDFDGLKSFFEMTPIEGIVWRHPDGRMIKIKAKDFGIKRGKP